MKEEYYINQQKCSCYLNSPYFLINNLFLELDTEKKKRIARLNLGITSFTAAQWEAINSNITSELVTKIGNSAESINVANHLSVDTRRMNKGGVYHYNKTLLHSRDILVDDGDIGGTAGGETACTIFCYHNPNSQLPHGLQYFVFANNTYYYNYLYTWNWTTAPKYVKQAFGEYTDSNDLTKVLIFDNPTVDIEKTVYERVIERIGEVTGALIPVIFYSYSDGFEIAGINKGWFTGYAYRSYYNKVRLELFGTAEDYGGVVHAYLEITNNNGIYSSSQGIYEMEAIASTVKKGLMSASDKVNLDDVTRKLQYVYRDNTNAAKLRFKSLEGQSIGYIGTDDGSKFNIKSSNSISVKSDNAMNFASASNININSGTKVIIQSPIGKLYLDHDEWHLGNSNSGIAKSVGDELYLWSSDRIHLESAHITTENGVLEIGTRDDIKGARDDIKIRSKNGKSSIALQDNSFKVVFPTNGDISFIEYGGNTPYTTLKTLVAQTLNIIDLAQYEDQGSTIEGFRNKYFTYNGVPVTPIRYSANSQDTKHLVFIITKGDTENDGINFGFPKVLVYEIVDDDLIFEAYYNATNAPEEIKRVIGYNLASTSYNGLMSNTDKVKLDALPNNTVLTTLLNEKINKTVLQYFEVTPNDTATVRFPIIPNTDILLYVESVTGQDVGDDISFRIEFDIDNYIEESYDINQGYNIIPISTNNYSLFKQFKGSIKSLTISSIYDIDEADGRIGKSIKGYIMQVYNPTIRGNETINASQNLNIFIGTDYTVNNEVNTCNFNINDNNGYDDTVSIIFNTGAVPNITFSSNSDIYAQDGLTFDANSKYEVNIRHSNGDYYIAAIKMVQLNNV